MPEKEKVLSQIKLKYFHNKPSKGQKPIKHDKPCYYCKRKFEKIGSVLDAYTDKPKMVCEDCAIWAYKYQQGLRTKKAAAARRRRMFDVLYLFQEMIADIYLDKNNIKSVNDLSSQAFEEIAKQGHEVYNSFFNKEDKIKLEELETQEEIERELTRALPFINM